MLPSVHGKKGLSVARLRQSLKLLLPTLCLYDAFHESGLQCGVPSGIDTVAVGASLSESAQPADYEA